MKRPSRKYVLDTQLFIQAFRDQRANDALQDFHRVFAPFEYFSVIVAHELRAGIQRSQDRKALEKNVLRIFARVNRTSRSNSSSPGLVARRWTRGFPSEIAEF